MRPDTLRAARHSHVLMLLWPFDCSERRAYRCRRSECLGSKHNEIGLFSFTSGVTRIQR